MTKTETEKKGTRTYDPEIAALARLDKQLALLDPEAARRVLAWLVAKYAKESNGQG